MSFVLKIRQFRCGKCLEAEKFMCSVHRRFKTFVKYFRTQDYVQKYAIFQMLLATLPEYQLLISLVEM